MKNLDEKTIDLITRAKKIHELLEDAKKLYKEKNALVDEILGLDIEEVELEGFTMKVVDCFADKNTKFRPAAFNRFELSFENLEV
tara:strand:+ start:36 stop:290 length:255 start_codon:yes stop_codon:yes gene_type:complete